MIENAPLYMESVCDNVLDRYRVALGALARPIKVKVKRAGQLGVRVAEHEQLTGSVTRLGPSGQDEPIVDGNACNFVG
jgi:hypothetical protein